MSEHIDVWPRNWLIPVVLATLREYNSYGYELRERVTQGFGFAEIKPGSVYRTLRRMERDGLCESRWEESESGPARRTYSITLDGVAYLDAWVEASKEYQRVLDSFAKAYTSNRTLRASSEDHETA